FVLNGRSFPFTLRDTPIVVKPDQMTKLRILNVGARTIYLHTHGHHPTLTHVDGYPLPKEARITRDTFDVGPAQRVDLALRTGSDGVYAAGPGVWLMHDHAQPAASNKGINPGGDHTAIIYQDFLGDDGLPIDNTGHAARAERCQEVEIILQNDDEVRHDLMIPGLNPMFQVAGVGPDIFSGRFVTPDEDVTLFLHCHVPMHDKVGMVGKLIVGNGGEPKTV